MLKRLMVLLSGIIFITSPLRVLAYNTSSPSGNTPPILEDFHLANYNKVTLPPSSTNIPTQIILSPSPTVIPTQTPAPSPKILRPKKVIKKPKNPSANSKTLTSSSGPSSAHDGLMEKYGKEYGVDPGKLKRMAKCESTFRPNAQNGIYGGMYQFSPATWRSTRKSMGLDPNPDLRYNPEEAIKTTAFKISRGGIAAWPVCGKR